MELDHEGMTVSAELLACNVPCEFSYVLAQIIIGYGADRQIPIPNILLKMSISAQQRGLLFNPLTAKSE